MKRAYQRPALVRYGTLAEVTLAVGMVGFTDNGPTGGQSNNKTRA